MLCKNTKIQEEKKIISKSEVTELFLILICYKNLIINET